MHDTGYSNSDSATAMDGQQQRNSITAQRTTATAIAIQLQPYSYSTYPVQKAKKIGVRI